MISVCRHHWTLVMDFLPARAGEQHLGRLVEFVAFDASRIFIPAHFFILFYFALHHNSFESARRNAYVA